MRIIFKFKSKILKPVIFEPKFKDAYFCTKLCNEKNPVALISNVTTLLQNRCPKYPNKAFLVLDLTTFIFARNFPFRKIWEWLKIWPYLFQILGKKYANKAFFFVPNLGIFILAQNYAIRQIPGHSFQLWR